MTGTNWSDRDVTLTSSEILHVADAVRDRIKILTKRLEKTSYAGKPGMKDAVVTEKRELEAVAAKLADAKRSITNQLVAAALVAELGVELPELVTDPKLAEKKS